MGLRWSIPLGGVWILRVSQPCSIFQFHASCFIELSAFFSRQRQLHWNNFTRKLYEEKTSTYNVFFPINQSSNSVLMYMNPHESSWLTYWIGQASISCFFSTFAMHIYLKEKPFKKQKTALFCCQSQAASIPRNRSNLGSTDQGVLNRTAHLIRRLWGLDNLVIQCMVLSPRVSGTQNGGTEPYNAILGMGFPLHKPYMQLI